MASEDVVAAYERILLADRLVVRRARELDAAATAYERRRTIDRQVGIAAALQRLRESLKECDAALEAAADVATIATLRTTAVSS